MGLDITVKRILKEPKYKDDYLRLLDNDGNYCRNEYPDWTIPFEQDKEEEWYDWEKLKQETGLDINECEWHGESYGTEGCFMKLWPKSAGKYPTPTDFLDEDGKCDYDKYQAVVSEHLIVLDIEKIPTYKKVIKVLYCEEVGYQRKGLNHKFYEDYDKGKIGYFVWSKAELERYKQDYCDEPYKYVYPNGKETDTMIYPKDNFQRNIIDNFIEGECCVTFSW